MILEKNNYLHVECRKREAVEQISAGTHNHFQYLETLSFCLMGSVDMTYCKPLIDVVETGYGSLIFTREVTLLGYESCFTLCKPQWVRLIDFGDGLECLCDTFM